MLNLVPVVKPEDLKYLAALALVVQIEAHLAYGRPLIDKSGRKLHELDEAVRAILDDTYPNGSNSC